jgi:hypothetical protein
VGILSLYLLFLFPNEYHTVHMGQSLRVKTTASIPDFAFDDPDEPHRKRGKTSYEKLCVRNEYDDIQKRYRVNGFKSILAKSPPAYTRIQQWMTVPGIKSWKSINAE